MSELRVATIEPEGATTSLTLGASGDTVTSSADSIKANTFKDAGGNTLWTSNGAGVLSSVNAGLQPSTGMKLLQTTTTSGNAESVAFTTGIDSTYDEYLFVWHNCFQASSTNGYFQFQCSTDGGSNYNLSSTWTYTYTNVKWSDGSSGSYGYNSWIQDAARGFTYITLTYNCSNSQAEGWCGMLRLFKPASTTYVKHFMAESPSATSNDYLWTPYVAGYFNTTSAINAINFKITEESTYFWNGAKFYMYGVT